MRWRVPPCIHPHWTPPRKTGHGDGSPWPRAARAGGHGAGRFWPARYVRGLALRLRIEARIAALRPQVDQAQALRQAIQSRAATIDVVQAERARVGDALGVLAALTIVLPDDTHLTELTLRRRVLSITGESAGAARLIAALEAEPAFRNPAFVAPVTRGTDGRAEAFSLRAEAAP